jgi:hypothetical protein
MQDKLIIIGRSNSEQKSTDELLTKTGNHKFARHTYLSGDTVKCPLELKEIVKVPW